MGNTSKCRTVTFVAELGHVDPFELLKVVPLVETSHAQRLVLPLPVPLLGFGLQWEEVVTSRLLGGDANLTTSIRVEEWVENLNA